MTTRLISQTHFPVDVAEAKLRLRIDGTAEDDDLELMIKAATQLATTMTRRSIASDTWQLKLDAFPDEIRLDYPPIVAVQSITYIDEAGATQTLASNKYIADVSSEPGRIVPAFGATWPATRNTINAVTVNYTAGYGGHLCPAAIKQFILLQVGHMYRTREAASDKPMQVVPFSEHLLDQYRMLEV